MPVAQTELDEVADHPVVDAAILREEVEIVRGEPAEFDMLPKFQAWPRQVAVHRDREVELSATDDLTILTRLPVADVGERRVPVGCQPVSSATSRASASSV